MSLLKGNQNEVWQNCTAKLPSDKKDIIVNFRVKFKRIPKSEYKELMNDFNGRNGNPDIDAVLADYILDWRMPGPDGTDVPFSKEVLVEEAFDNSHYLNAILDAFIGLHQANWKELKAKNS
jgi:hypothetical protein